MICPSCKNENREESNFCRFCGNKLFSNANEIDNKHFNVSRFTFLANLKKLRDKLSPKVIIVSILILLLSVTSVFAAPKVKDYLEVNKVIKQVRELQSSGNYEDALASLAQVTDKWVLSSQKDKLNELEEKQNQYIEYTEIFVSALEKEKEGALSEAREMLKTIKSDFPGYNLVEERINIIQDKIEQGLKTEIEEKEEEVLKIAGEKKTAEEWARTEAEAKRQAQARAETEAEAKREAEAKAQTEAEAKRQAEIQAQTEAEARKQAEQKAKKEEQERRIKEQELADKEAEEKRMNADNDGDGLTYREELSKGTSDWDNDSDDDGINDGEDIHPTGDGKDEVQYFEWEYNGQDWDRIFTIHEDWVQYYKQKERAPHGLNYVTGNDQFIQEIAKELKKIADRESYDLTLFVVAFVQGIPYVADFYTGFTEYPKYPVETIIDRNGDCEDTTYVAASIVSATGIGIALLEFDNHMALGVWGEESISGYYYETDSKRFYYIETTSKDLPFGAMPNEYKSKEAKITQWNGKVSYGYAKYQKPCDSSLDFPGYYYDGFNFYSDNQCYNLVSCLPFSDYYFDTNSENLYHDSSCTQLFVKGCYKSKSYPGKFYKSGEAWYYDYNCVEVYKSMTCDYPSSYAYTCAYESSYNLKKSTCDYYESSSYLSDLADSCYEELAQCLRDIDEYQVKLDEYNQCKDRKEY